MHILPEKFRSDARRTIPYACASVLTFQTNCTIVMNPYVFNIITMNPFYGCKLLQKAGS